MKKKYFERKRVRKSVKSFILIFFHLTTWREEIYPANCFQPETPVENRVFEAVVLNLGPVKVHKSKGRTLCVVYV
jgi:hypothetical protein